MLQSWERRCDVGMEPWEAYASALPPGTTWKRLCVIDLRTQEKLFDFSRFRSPGPLPRLCATTDQGGGNMPMVQFMQGDLHLRLLWFQDLTHKYTRDWALAAKHAETCGHLSVRGCIAWMYSMGPGKRRGTLRSCPAIFRATIASGHVLPLSAQQLSPLWGSNP